MVEPEQTQLRGKLDEASSHRTNKAGSTVFFFELEYQLHQIRMTNICCYYTGLTFLKWSGHSVRHVLLVIRHTLV